MTITLQALSLVEKVEPVQGPRHTTLEGPTEHLSECETLNPTYLHRVSDI
jgi:hypothetical protein